MSTTSERARSLPGIAPSGRGQFPRLQLRGSAGVAPASLSSLYGEDARSKCDGKEQKQQREEFKGWRRLKSNRGCGNADATAGEHQARSTGTKLIGRTDSAHTVQRKGRGSPATRLRAENKMSCFFRDTQYLPAVCLEAGSCVPAPSGQGRRPTAPLR